MLRMETQQERVFVHKHNTGFVKVWLKHKKNPQALQLCRSHVVPYKFVHVGLGYAKQNKPM